MFSRKNFRIFPVIAPLVGSAIAANSVTYDFESSGSGDLFAGGGVTGWSQDTTNPSAFGQTFPLAYIAATDFGGGSSVSAHLGTQQSNTPDNADTTLTGDLSSLDPIYNMLNVSFNMAVLDDSSDSYEGRDAFNIALTTASGSQVATIGLAPKDGDNETWNVSVGVNGSTSTTPYQISANSAYSLYIASRDSVTDFRIGPAGGISESMGSFTAATSLNSVTGITFEHDPLSPVGTSAHTLAFDNVSVQIPEPSSSLLMVLSAGLIAIRRRR
ncbi:MAG: hypothetical protein CMI29_06170 [Opitutae bacterium]|mgnify:CR=1 FL=1|nr:hypothetical protein [Opitutae bacterium]|tara:strand:+ start:934 stop:1746 length:813 start_codon:yes stop_codon:yes gene_type:complete